jgi:hypothetical protein
MPSKKPKLRSDPSHARAHGAGTRVSLNQLLQHRELGTVALIYDPPPRFWGVHFDLAVWSAKKLADLQERLLSFPVKASEVRDIDDHAYLAEIYAHGSTAVVHAVIACQQLTDEIERSCEGSLGGLLDPMGRLAEAAKLAGMNPASEYPGWNVVGELVAVRHAVEHPRAATYLNHDDPLQVPLAWMVSERPGIVFPAYQEFFTSFTDSWLRILANRPRQLRRFTVKRGMVATSPAKRKSRPKM